MLADEMPNARLLKPGRLDAELSSFLAEAWQQGTRPA